MEDEWKYFVEVGEFMLPMESFSAALEFQALVERDDLTVDIQKMRRYN